MLIHHAARLRHLVSLAGAAVLLATTAAGAQAPRPAALPVFPRLLADPQEPQFFANYLFSNSSQLGSGLGTVGFGQIISLAKGSNWQVSIAPAICSSGYLETTFDGQGNATGYKPLDVSGILKLGG